jgi:hypothetical protein
MGSLRFSALLLPLLAIGCSLGRECEKRGYSPGTQAYNNCQEVLREHYRRIHVENRRYTSGTDH